MVGEDTDEFRPADGCDASWTVVRLMEFEDLMGGDVAEKD